MKFDDIPVEVRTAADAIPARLAVEQHRPALAAQTVPVKDEESSEGI